MRDLTRLILPEVREMLASGETRELAKEFARLHPADIADLISHLEEEEGAKLFLALEPSERVEVFEHLDESVQVKLVELVGKGPMIEGIEAMSPDDRADLIQALPEKTREAILPLLAQAERNETRRLLSYPEGSAGSVMTTEFATIPPDLTVREALDHLRRAAPSRETIYYIYVTDENRKLIGVLSLKNLVLAEPDQVVKDIMEPDVIVVRVDEDQEEVARVVEKYDFLAIPVVDHAGRLVGIITQDDIIDVIREEATEDAQKMAAMEPLETTYRSSSFWELVRKRGTWLLLLFFAEMLTGETLAAYESTWRTIAVLVSFVPLIIATGGNAGGQSAVLVIRSLALGEISLKDWSGVIMREIGQGMVLGLILGSVGLLRALLWNDPSAHVMGFQLGIAVGISLVAVVTLGTLIGSTLPLVFKRLGMDPAIMSSPSIACTMDVLGMLTYFSIADLILFKGIS